METLPLLLIAEDEPLVRTCVADALNEGGYTLIETDSGSEAIAQLDAQEHLAGLITDIKLGRGPDGWEVARHARQRFPTIAVIYMTGDSAADWTSEGVPNSIVLQKPFAMAQVVTGISGLLITSDINPV